MTDADLKRLCALARTAAVAAGDALVRERLAWRAVESEEGREVKLRADRGAEALIVAALQAGSPYPILSEEIGWVGGADRDVVWAVDPLDGSVNYAQGFPHWAVSIALVVAGRPTVGVVHLPALGETFTGVAGVGAACNDAPVAVSAVDDPARGVLMTGIPARAATDADAMAALQARLLRWRKVRMIGSAACALAYVAAGRADAYHETGGMLWDVAGGCALVTAAGGIAAITADALDAPLDVRAGNGRVAL
ncbi:MAG: inositol monophosphatase family protein [Hyphomonadaceae bacterium]|nr:inositol monophosphatase family protein [Hyphomonadaceae bacterium]